MSPFLFDADLGVTELGQRARAAMTVTEASVLSISDLFAAFVEARGAGDKDRMKRLRAAAGPEVAAELDGFNDHKAAA